MMHSNLPLRTQQGGYIALMAVLVVGAAATSIALGLLVRGADSQNETIVTQHSAQARNLATACAEEALQQIHDTPSTTSPGNLVYSTGTCSYTITSTGASTRTINASGVAGTDTRRLIIYVTINSSSISIVSWQEASDAV